ncbi:hypothetical protein A2165_00170 [Candidatus Curtissbacteria bacterium RBG_13_40_7]|uniref:Uncharacterized protein n=1 Tax=Candidatus Curtissbacteria bacterium RBG_13_40_7 TaxID=1797706 RepID=A0A1F5FY57_9BACT|nr:MAG: hypothetical protein A2165_00170 [Candidatus Curtissbacteria bacterium RBG_13_40_7]
MQERCLQFRTGSCMGCNVQELLERRIKRNGSKDVFKVADPVEKEMCPDGAIIAVPQARSQVRRQLRLLVASLNQRGVNYYD